MVPSDTSMQQIGVGHKGLFERQDDLNNMDIQEKELYMSIDVKGKNASGN